MYSIASQLCVANRRMPHTVAFRGNRFAIFGSKYCFHKFLGWDKVGMPQEWCHRDGVSYRADTDTHARESRLPGRQRVEIHWRPTANYGVSRAVNVCRQTTHSRTWHERYTQYCVQNTTTAGMIKVAQLVFSSSIYIVSIYMCTTNNRDDRNR